MNTRYWALLRTVILVTLSGCAMLDGNASESSIQFEDATNATGINYGSFLSGEYENGNEGVYVADVDRDGWQDLLVGGSERPALYTNENGTFQRSDEGSFEQADVDLGNFSYPLGATAADFDDDGDEDLFIYQSGDWREGKPAGYFELNGTIENDNGNSNVLLENTGGEYQHVEDAGLEGDHWSLAASAVDVNDDGEPDIHVANDFYYDELYVNRGNGTFEHRYLGNRTARNGMSSEVADVDGHPDVFVTNIHFPLRDELSDERYERIQEYLTFVVKSNRTESNTLLINDGEGNFTDRAGEYGVHVGGWGSAATFTDFDNDGEEDLLQATQNVLPLDRSDPHYTYPMLWEGSGDGFISFDASDRGLNEDDGRGLVAVDYDNDGDREVITNNHLGNVTVYDNVGSTGNSLQVRIVDGDDGTTVLGAVVRIEAGGESTVVYQTDRTDFLAQGSLVNHVGVGDAESATVHVS